MPTPEHDEDAFGFGAVGKSAKDKIRQIRPAAPPEPPADLSRVDEVAGNAGFVSREAIVERGPAIRRGRPAAPEPTVALNMRAPASLADAFKRWSEENRYSYPAALAEIMRLDGISTK